jgi:ectoine hydroxylase-related dioxygenase (phytanoyl-CoA dioxygenase family)
MEVQDHAEQLRSAGYTIVPGVLSPSEIETARTLLARLWEEEREPGARYKWHNKSWIISYCLPPKHEFFRNLVMKPKTLELMRTVLGRDCILSSLNGMNMVPKGEPQRLHLDQHEHVPKLVININGTYALDDFTKANGATRLVPRSQDRAPGTPIDHEADERDAVYLEAPAGSLLAFNGGIVHAGSANTTAAPRRCIHTFYSRPWVRAQWNFVHSFSDDVKATLTEEQKQIFGFYVHEQVYDVRTHEIRRGAGGLARTSEADRQMLRQKIS